MKPCPPPELLRRLLADQLTAAEELELDTHLRSCRDCRQRLDQLTASDPATTSCDGCESPPTGSVLPSHDGRPWLHPDFLLRLEDEARSDSAAAITRAHETLGGPIPDVPGFEIRNRLGSGGMAVVYKARDLRLN